ncbi:hypothetical protein TNCV_1592451, partial [Trichonephila clavipes]
MFRPPEKFNTPVTPEKSKTKDCRLKEKVTRFALRCHRFPRAHA